MSYFYGVNSEFEQRFLGDGNIFIPKFDRPLKKIGQGYDVETGKYKCNESGIWSASWSLNIANISSHNFGGLGILKTGLRNINIYSGNPANEQSCLPPPDGLNNMITICGSLEFPVNIAFDPYVWIEIRINGNNKFSLSLSQSSYFSISKHSKLAFS